MSMVWKYERMRIISQRMIVLIAIFFVFILILVARLFYLQLIEGERYLKMAEKNRTALHQTLPARGYIYDRNGVKLAENRKTFLAILMREQTNDYQNTLKNFQKIISLDEEELKRIEKEVKQKRAFMPIRIKDNLSFEEAAKIQLNAPDLMGIQIQEEVTRFYPLGEDVAHVVGYVSLLTDRDSSDYADSPLLDLPGYRIGRVGIEEAFETILQGTPGLRKTEINAYGRSVRILEETKAKKGGNLTLTIDADLQKFALKTMGNEAGSALVLDIQTGEILSLVSTPSFDANVFTMPIPRKIWQNLIGNEKKPLQNKAINGVYSPGSIFKLVVALAGLETGHITAKRKIFCSGHVEIGNHYFHCWKNGGHGHLTLEEALMHSCDVYFYQVAQEIGPDKILEVARRLGFGSLTGTRLTGEKSGLLPSKSWKKEKYDEDWRLGDTLNLSIGQGYLLATPIQIARAVAQIANGGYQIQPHLIKEETQNKAELRKSLGFKQSHIRLVQSGMNMVVNKIGGTGYKARFNIEGKTMAGKTASTQVRRISMKERKAGVIAQEKLPWKYRDHAMFAAFAPVEAPRFAVAVVVEHGGGGSRTAAPIASQIMQETLKLYPQQQGELKRERYVE